MTPSDLRLISLALLSFAVLDNFGNLSSLALVCVLLSVALCILSFGSKPVGRPLPRAVVIGVLLALAALTILYDTTMPQLSPSPPPRTIFVATSALLVMAVLLYSLVKATAAKVIAFGMAAASLVTGIAANISWGYANIDVFQFQQAASRALLNGQNPYSPVVRSPEIVAPGVPAWLQLHFPYGPVLPVIEAPFRLLGDIRVLHVIAACITAAAVLLLARRAGTLDRSACVAMAFPLTTGMVLFSWVDVITMAGLAAWMVLFRSHPRLATFALVLALAVKPTTFIALVPIFFWSIRARRQVIIAVIIAALFVLPFAAITGFRQFYYNVLGVQLAVLPRLDSLTLNSYLNSFNLPILPFAVSGLIIAAATFLVLRRRPTTYGEILTASAILATVSFLVAKWAYFNYYYIPAVLLMLAIAGDALVLDVPEMIQPPAVLLKGAAWWTATRARVRGDGRVPGTVASDPSEGERAA